MKFKFLLLVLLVVYSASAIEDLPREKASSLEGVHFLVGFMQNEWRVLNTGIGVEQRLFISAKSDAEIEVLNPFGNEKVVHRINQDSVLILLFNDFIQMTSSEIIEDDKLVEIKSDVPISVYAFSSQQNTSDSWAVIPTVNWGRDYIAVSMPNDQYERDEPPRSVADSLNSYIPRQSQFAIMAAYDNTEVVITPTYTTQDNRPGGDPFTVTLNKGEAYQVKSQPTSKGRGDLTGSRIFATKPIGVISGHERSSVPVGLAANRDSKDNLVEMLMPVEAWGTTYVSIPFDVNPLGDFFKVTSLANNTTVQIIGQGIDTQLSLGDDNIYELKNVTEPLLWRSNNPIQLAQFMMRSNDTASIIENYDPCMVMLPPVEQFISRVRFQTPGNNFFNPNQYEKHYAYVIAEEEALDFLKLDGELLDTTTAIRQQKIRSVDLFWAIIELKEGKHILESEEGRFSGVLYGTGIFDSYGMVLGTSLNKPGIDDDVLPNITLDEGCDCVVGTITDEVSQRSFGIKYATFPDDALINYNIEMDYFEPGEDEIQFTACVDDPTKNAEFTVEFYDLDGNGRRLSYDYLGVNYNYTEDIDFQTVSWEGQACQDIIITNTGIRDLRIDELSIPNESRLSITLEEDLPFSIKRGDTFTATICFEPDRDSTILNSSVQISLNNSCVLDEIPILGSVKAVNLVATGYDFGANLVGEEVCDVVSVQNFGNEPVVITDLVPDNTFNVFTFDTSILPYELQPNDILEIDVCFNASARINYETDFIFENSEDVNVVGSVSGVGLAPELIATNIDWGRRRVGTQNDTTWIVSNIGDFDAEILFDQFVSIDNQDNLSNFLSNISQSIASESEYEFEITFEPTNVGNYLLEASFTSDWEFQEPFAVSFEGIGTLPEIETFNFSFDDTNIYSEQTESVSIFNTAGNEELYVEELFVIDGDVDAFNLDLEAYSNISLNSGIQVFENITFAPTRLGYHELILGVMHDANPNYELSVDTIVISGNSVPEPNTNFESNIDVDRVIACNTSQFTFTIRNTGETKVDITNLDFNFVGNETGMIVESSIENSSLYENLSTDKPLVLEINEELLLDFEVISTSGDFVEFILEIELFGEQTINFLENIDVIENEIFINNIEDTEISPGDKFTVNITGSLNGSNELSNNLLITIFTDNYFLHLESEQVNVNLTDINGSFSYSAQVEQLLDRVNIMIPDEVISYLGDQAEFDLNVEFLQLLDDKESDVINVVVNSDKCYTENNAVFTAKINDICVFDLRTIEINGNLNSVQVSPNPVSDFINVNFFSKENMQQFNYFISDINGTKILQDRISLNNGYNEFQLDVSEVPNGTYFLNFNNSKENHKLMFVIIK